MEYLPGDLNLIITVPHNGEEKPEGLEDRFGTALMVIHCITDTVFIHFTFELAMQFSERFHSYLVKERWLQGQKGAASFSWHRQSRGGKTSSF